MNTLLNIVKFHVVLLCCVLCLASELLAGLSILLYSIGEILEDMIDE